MNNHLTSSSNASLWRRQDSEQWTHAEQLSAGAFAHLLYRYLQEDVVSFWVSRKGEENFKHVVLQMSPTSTGIDIQRQVETALPSKDQYAQTLAGVLRLFYVSEAKCGAENIEQKSFLTLEVGSTDDEVHVTRAPAHGLFGAPANIPEVEAHFRRARRGLATRANAAICEISLLTTRERNRLLDVWTRPEVEQEDDICGLLLHNIFEEQVRKRPHHAAVVLGDKSATYKSLDDRATLVAARLQSLGVGRGDLVALLLPRSFETYAAMLGVLKAGAAYLPLDPDYPRQRVEYILADSHAKVLVSLAALTEPNTYSTPVVFADDSIAPPDDFLFRPMSAQTDDPCYIIYTSGSTGQPKGVVIEHGQAVSLVRAERSLFQVSPDDRVFQGFSIAFDASVEEIWLAWAAGASLVVGTKDILLGDVANHLTRLGVTVFSTVPTLLATLTSDLPSVRLLILGGESCPPALVARFGGGRKLFNTYGPTEATVIATAAQLRPGEPVTIGHPTNNNRVYVIDACGDLAAPGVAGEIAISGQGVARGYLGQPQLTAQRFIPNPFGAGQPTLQRLYRTGDRGRFDAQGRIEFLGRMDDQVKIRGFRVELGEIEAALMDFGAGQAVVLPLTDDRGDQQLIAYVAPCDGKSIGLAGVKEYVRSRLPSYMVPARIELIESMPTLVSGKIDKKSLTDRTAAPLQELDSEACEDPPQGPVEEAIASVWRGVFGTEHIGRKDDFFFDLAGHSLLAAKTISLLRQQPSFSQLSIADLYEAPTIEQLSARARSAIGTGETANEVFAAQSRWKHIICGAAQAVGLYFVFALAAAQWLTPYGVFFALRQAAWSIAPAVGVALATVLAIPPMLFPIAIVCKWAIVGRYRTGSYPLWGSYFFRCWLVDQILAAAPTSLIEGTPLLNAYYRLLGAKIGRSVFLATDCMSAHDLVEIGDNANIGADVRLATAEALGGVFHIGPVEIGEGCVVGARSVLSRGSVIEAQGELEPLSLLPSGCKIPSQELWTGSPAQKVCLASLPVVALPPDRLRSAFMVVVYAIVSMLLPSVRLLALTPAIALLVALDGPWGAWSMMSAPIGAALFTLVFCLLVVLIKRISFRGVRASSYPLHGKMYFGYWIFQRLMDMSFESVGALYATLLVNPWLRLLGVTLGRDAEVSTASGFVPELTTIAEQAFVADAVALGPGTVRQGRIRFGETNVGARCFVGNSAFVGSESFLPADGLIGCLSRAPNATDSQGHREWFGSPPTALRQREQSPSFAPETTYSPSRTMVAQRFSIELLRIVLPTMFGLLLGCGLLRGAERLIQEFGMAVFVAAFPLAFIGAGLVAAGLVVAIKWMVVGRYQPGQHPLWSSFVWLSELVTALHENLANPFLVHALEGTPFAVWYFRALGARIGHRVYLGTSEMTEFDLIGIGDEACLNDSCTLQTHLFEDRVMKMSYVSIGSQCSVGADAVVLYDTQMEAGACLGPLSLLMKGETLPAGNAWQGSPARAVGQSMHQAVAKPRSRAL